MNGSPSATTFYSCTKSTNHNPANVGSYAMRLENNTSLSQMQGGWGIAVTNAFDYPFKPAFALPTKPTIFCGYYNFTSLNNDTAWLKLIVFNQGVIVGDVNVKLAHGSGNWGSFQYVINYGMYSGPVDSATLIVAAFYPSTPTDGPNGNSILFVDNLSFQKLVVFGEEENDITTTEIRVFPNPAANLLTLDFGKEPEPSTVARIISVTGETVMELIANEQRLELGIQMLENGIYILEIQTKFGSTWQKIIIQK